MSGRRRGAVVGRRRLAVGRWRLAVGRWGLALGLWAAVARGGEPEARQAAHWLRYVAADYGGAVRQGKIVLQEEYDEQLALLDRAAGLLAALPEDKPSRGAIRRLRGLVEARGAAEELAPLARATAERLLRSAGGSVPAAVPSLERGREVYGRACASCHGADGGGRTPVAAQLRPPPADLSDPVRNEERSPLGVALAVEFGIPGTAMGPHPELSGRERWDVAFFAAALPWEAGREGQPEGEAPALSLEELTSLQNRELRAALEASGLAPERVEPWLSWFRRTPPSGDPSAASRARGALRRAAALAVLDPGASRAEVQAALTAARPLATPASTLAEALAPLEGAPSGEHPDPLEGAPSGEHMKRAEIALLRADLRAAPGRSGGRWWPPVLLLPLVLFGVVRAVRLAQARARSGRPSGP